MENGVALLCTVAFAASWLAFAYVKTGSPATPRPAAQAVRLHLMPDPGVGPGASVWDRDPRAVWSPVLFALPTAAGFSPSRAQRAPRSTLVHSAAGPGGLLLDLAPATGERTPLLHGRTPGEVEALYDRRWSRIPAADDPFSVAASAGPVLHAEWPDGTPALAAGWPLVLDPPAGPDERSWEATALVYFNPEGDVRSVFLEQSSASRERNEATLRALRRMRTAPGGYPNPARVNLYLQPAPARAAGGGA